MNPVFLRAASRCHATLRRAATALGVVALIAGCNGFGPATTALRFVTVIATSDANNSSATALDLVFVHDAATAAALPRTGPEWFARRQSLLIALGPKVEVRSVELPPDQSAQQVRLPARYKQALTVYCYVNFVAPQGQGVADLTPYKRVRITLTSNTVTYDGER